MIYSRIFMSWGMLILSVLFNAFSIFLIKNRLNALGEIQFSSLRYLFNYGIEFIKSPGAIIGLILFVASPFFLAVAVSRMDMTVAYPVQLSLNFLLVIILSLLYLNEPLSWDKGIGIGLVLISIYFLAK